MGNQQRHHVNCACATCMRERSKEGSTAVHVNVWARFVVVVVLAARLSLPGRPELIKLGLRACTYTWCKHGNVDVFCGKQQVELEWLMWGCKHVYSSKRENTLVPAC